MNKERELLRRISSHSESRLTTNFIYEIQELLAQPEQSNEPVAWAEVEYAKELLTQPEKTEQEPSASAREMYQRGYAHAERDLKRKLLGLGIIEDDDLGCYERMVAEGEDVAELLYDNTGNVGDNYSSQEPLSDKTIVELWGDKHSGKTLMVRNFVRAIEKAHGITGDKK